MKYDITKKHTLGSKRALNAFSNTLFALLSIKDFNKITVDNICELSNYPRATFYNYFYSKYDLLEYCWYIIGAKICLDDYQDLDPERVFYLLFDRVYSYFDTHCEMINAITANNDTNSYANNSFKASIKNSICKIFDLYCATRDYSIPHDVLANHYGNTIILKLETRTKNKTFTKEQALEYLTYLLGDLEQKCRAS